MKAPMTPEEFTVFIARMRLNSEIEQGMDDAVSTLDELIASARQITGINPGYPNVEEI